ncbi:helix-turn-helix domain-containing protein [Pseudonocardia lacus]|uniref:helix-turn-helix domain-containing protein n=1 Tax=Pseudonocardia lacus TaxID=2835865 RepID=UPI001BDD00F7|nr:helix-turn-helix domain-containing protein [Pseudonocardia lacus]
MAKSTLHSVVLSAEEREWLTRVVRTGAHPAQEVRRSRILLELDDSRGQPASRREIAGRVGVDPETISNVAKVYVERDGDVVATIQRKKRLTPPVEPKITGEVEARLIALACSTPPPGHARACQMGCVTRSSSAEEYTVVRDRRSPAGASPRC